MMDWTDKLGATLLGLYDNGKLPVDRPLPPRAEASSRAMDAVMAGRDSDAEGQVSTDILPVVVRCTPGMVDALAASVSGAGRVGHRLYLLNAVSGWVVPEAIWHLAQLSWVVAIEENERFQLMTIVRDEQSLRETGTLPPVR